MRLRPLGFAFGDFLQVGESEGDPVAVAMERDLSSIGTSSQSTRGHLDQAQMPENLGGLVRRKDRSENGQWVRWDRVVGCCHALPRGVDPFSASHHWLGLAGLGLP